MAHANARLTPAGRLTLVGRIAAQPRRPIAHLAHEMGVSRATASRWWATSSSARPAWSTGPASPPTAPGGPLPSWRSASSGCAAASGSARPASPPGWVYRPPPSIGSWSATG
jgi:hypothetical protein